MAYYYEQLGPERFQQFAQALVAAERPGVQCFPVGQPDGGRDALQLPYFTDSGSAVVFQVKFVRDPSKIDDPHKWLVEQMLAEAPKVARLLERGPIDQYYLITNLHGTAHLDAGSIDRLQAVLHKHLSVPAMAWWRTDLDRRLDGAAKSIRWAYPEVLRGSDVLELLVDNDLGENRRRRADAITAFVADQYDLDEEVRFKQVELQNDLLDLFTDVPAIVTKGPGDRRARFEDAVMLSHIISRSIENDAEQPVTIYYDHANEPIGAAALLLDEHAQRRFNFVVLEGAPGQGKSTLAQFICQVYRLKLRRDKRVRNLESRHMPALKRLPIKVDLTEYAAWQSGKNPFDAAGDEATTRSGSRSLESFIAALIRNGSGGATFEVEDLHSVLRGSLALIVLDGLDEVAETRRRDLVIQEINSTARRFKEISPGVQVVVTTRPSAFAGVSDFSRRLFYHLQLTTLSHPLIMEYAERWSAAKKITQRDAAQIRRSLIARLQQPHVRDLATNPMQLAILLSVIHSRGTSLPDKRTALYDIYVELFLARESEKTTEVREHGELLVDVHQYLGYTLHARAEAGGHLGRVSYDKLMEILQSYLLQEGRDPALADALFAGAQRVVFLVARVEGTFEFEVQPLREYFAGKYLYETSAYSPVGNERRGTMPDRFDALSRNPYWLNVTRFFAGSLSKGELPALVDRLQSLTEDSEYRYISYPRYLAATLLADWVFSQHQRSVKAVVAVVLDGPGLRALVRSGSTTRQRVLSLPSGAGRTELIDGAFSTLDSQSRQSDSLRGLAAMLQANASREELLPHWKRWSENAADAPSSHKWLAIAHLLGLLSALPSDDVIRLALQAGAVNGTTWCIRGKRYREVLESPELFECIMDSAVDASLQVSRSRVRSAFEAMMLPFSRYWHRSVHASGGLGSYSLQTAARNIYERSRSAAPKLDELPSRLTPLVEGARAAWGASLDEWRSSIEPWSVVVEPARRIWTGYPVAIVHTALAAALAKDPLSDQQRAFRLLDHSADLCARLRVAKLRAGNTSWWARQLGDVHNFDDVKLLVSAFITSAGPTVVLAHVRQVDALVAELGDDELASLRACLRDDFNFAFGARGSRRVDVGKLPAELSEKTVALLGARMGARGRVALRDRYLLQYAGRSTIVQDFRTNVAVSEILMAGDDADAQHWALLLEALESPGAGPGRAIELVLESGNSRTYGMSLEVARRIAAEGQLPDPLLTIAERVCELATFEKSQPIAEVADREDWFGGL